MKTPISILILALSIYACTSTPSPINYGQDACHFCKMSIVDKQHAAQMVTKKGRNYKYDAIECLVNDLSNWEQASIGTLLVSDYNQPGTLIPATEAYYLISPSITSPMGANLSAFNSVINRKKYIANQEDKALPWNELAP